MSCIPGQPSVNWKDMFCTWSAGDKETAVLVEDTDSTTRADKISGKGGVNAYGLRVLYEPTNIATSTSMSALSSAPVSTSTTDPDKELGVEAAIGVVVPVVVIRLLGSLFWYRRRKRGLAKNRWV